MKHEIEAFQVRKRQLRAHMAEATTDYQHIRSLNSDYFTHFSDLVLTIAKWIDMTATKLSNDHIQRNSPMTLCIPIQEEHMDTIIHLGLKLYIIIKQFLQKTPSAPNSEWGQELQHTINLLGFVYMDYDHIARQKQPHFPEEYTTSPSDTERDLRLQRVKARTIPLIFQQAQNICNLNQLELNVEARFFHGIHKLRIYIAERKQHLEISDGAYMSLLSTSSHLRLVRAFHRVTYRVFSM